MIRAKLRLNCKPIRAKLRMQNVQVVSADLSTINTAIDALNGEVLPGQAVDKLAVTSATKSAIEGAIESKGVDVPSDTAFSAYPGLISDIVQLDITPINTAIDVVNGEIIDDDTLAKLATTNSTKAAIESAIESKGVDVPLDTPFSAYPVLIGDIVQNDVTPINDAIDALNGEIIAGDTFAKLTTTSNTKQAIETAIESKGVDVPSATVFSAYPDLIGSISKRSLAPQLDLQPYVRPADWLTLPTFTDTDQKIVCLMAVHDNKRNLIAFNCQGNFSVDWGDGVIENLPAGNAYHEYDFAALPASTLTTEGYRQAILVVTPQAGQNITSFSIINYTAPKPVYEHYTVVDMVIRLPFATTFSIGSSSSYGWSKLQSLVSFKMLSALNLTSFSRFFNYCIKLQNVELLTSNITNFSYCFEGCYSLQAVNLFDTQSASTMVNMFMNCYNLQIVPAFNTAAVVTMASMFNNCYCLQTIPLFNTISVTTMINMFQNCRNLQSMPLLDMRNVTTLANTFDNCWSLQTIPLFNTISVTTMNSTFLTCISLQTVPALDMRNVTIMTNMFLNCFSLQSVAICNTSKVISMTNAFNGCYSLLTIPLLDTISVLAMDSAFLNCYSLQSIPLLDTRAVNNMSSMFNGCYCLRTIPLLNTSLVQNMGSMFYNCSSLQSIPLLDMRNVTNTASMFFNCYSLKALPLLNTVKVTNASSMLSGCSSLQDLPTFNFTAATNISNLLYTCSNLHEIPAFSWAAVTSSSNIIGTSAYCLRRIRATGLRYGLNLTNAALERDALVELFTNLGTAAGAQTVTITSNPGAAALTAADRLIATSKGWTITG